VEFSSSSVCAEDEFSPLSVCLWTSWKESWLRLLLFILKQLRKHLLEAVDRFLLSPIILSCSLWAWTCCSKRLAISSGVLVIYAKVSFSTEEFKAYDSVMAECDSLTSMPQVRALWSTGAIIPVRVRVCRTLLSARCQTRRAEYWLYLFNSAWHIVWTHHIRSNFRILHARESSPYAGMMPFGWRETDVDDNHLNTDCLQWHSESTVVMSRSQQHSRVI